MRVLLLSLVLAACAAGGVGGNLANTHWRMQGVTDERGPTIDFTADSAGGRSGCNHWFAEVEARGEALRFSGVGGTEMACDPPAMDVEQRFYAMMGQVRAHRIEGDTLILLDSAGAELARFARTQGE